MGVNFLMGRGLSIYISCCLIFVFSLLLYSRIILNPKSAGIFFIGILINLGFIIYEIIKYFKERKNENKNL